MEMVEYFKRKPIYQNMVLTKPYPDLKNEGTGDGCYYISAK